MYRKQNKARFDITSSATPSSVTTRRQTIGAISFMEYDEELAFHESDCVDSLSMYYLRRGIRGIVCV